MILAALASACADSATVNPVTRSCVIPQPVRTDWRLHAEGMQLRDALGRVVLLRGVNGGGRSKFAPYMPFDYPPGGFDAALARYMDRAKSWGIDAMRVPFTWAAVEPVEGADDQDFLRRYDALLDAAWARGIWTIVDFHQDVYAEAFCGDGFPAWTIPGQAPPPHHDCPTWGLAYFDDPKVVAAFDRFWADGSPVQAAYASMWDRMVARYADRPGVVGFELINEPASGSADVGTFSETTLTAFYTRMVSRIRAAATRALVFVDPLGLDGLRLQTRLMRPAGDGVVFAPHFYPLSRNPESVLGAMASWSAVGESWKVPVFVGEFGALNGGEQRSFIAAHFDAFDALELSGTEWEYSVAGEAWNGEAASIVAADGTELAVAGAIVRPFARAVAGSAISTSFDSATRTFTLDFSPAASGVTEVSLPSRLYAAGIDVRLTGACADDSHTGELLVEADPGATRVALHVTPR